MLGSGSNSSTGVTQTYQMTYRQKQGIWGFGPGSEIIAQGGVHQKRDIVDTKTHALCVARQNTTKQSGFPTT